MPKYKHIKPLPVIDFSGFRIKPGLIKHVKKQNYFIVKNITITGDAPKDFVRYYSYVRDGKVRKSNPKTWPLYLAKHGHKHYPMEAVTEHLLNRIGATLGFNMAESDIVYMGNQIRFLSKYFLTQPKIQILDHGADLYAGYLNDKIFVEEIEKAHQSPDFITVQLTETTLKYFFPVEYPELMLEFIKLLVFDALIGNNDRHFYNWGIVRDILGNSKPYFSPIYDTARGLFWNEHEEKIRQIYYNKSRINSFIEKYSEASSPKIGWENSGKLNHFQLVERIITLPYAINCSSILNICSNEALDNVDKMIDTEFNELLSYERRQLIKTCFRYRQNRIKKIINFAP